MWSDWTGIPGYHQPIGQAELSFASQLLAKPSPYHLTPKNYRYDLLIEIGFPSLRAVLTIGAEIRRRA
jgi:hypothetical protein